MKRFSLLVWICISACCASCIQAQTAIPYLPQLSNFGGSSVATATFSLPNGDYTLEVQATAGTAISVAGQYTYTPTASGTVRFAQRKGVIYVYEGNTFKTTFTVFPAIYEDTDNMTSPGQGIYNAANLLKNPGFEGNETALTLIDGTSYQDNAVWSVYNASKALNWGAASPNSSIRQGYTAYLSEGNYSLIVHGDSRYVTQKLDAGKLKPNTYYKLDYYFWSSSPASGNGGASYQILLGTTSAGNDLLTIAGHTTPTTTEAKQTFSTLFLTPATIPTGTDVWFTFFRNQFGVDWLDRICLVEGRENVPAGITGVTSAVCLNGTAYAPEISLQNGDYYDMTAYFLVNPEFNDATMVNNAPVGWTKTFSATTSEISTAAKGDGKIIVANENHWRIYHGSALSGKAYQTVSGLPNGKYTVKAGLYASFNGEVFLYANDGKTSITRKNAAYFYEATGIVYNGQLEIGLNIASTSSVTADFDHITLSYDGDDMESYTQILAEKLAIAQTCLAGSGHDAGYINSAQLNAAIALAQSESHTAETIVEAIAALDAAITEYNAIITAYKPLKAKLSEAKALSDTTAYPGKAVFEAAIAAAQAVYDSPENQRSNIVATLIALNKATIAYLNSRPSSPVTIRNGALWMDNRGQSVQAHGAGFLQTGDTWYMIGEDRETAQWNPDINMYSTKDFTNWKYEGKVVENGKHSYTYADGTTGSLGSNRMIERPKLLYCERTGQYIIWCHWEAGNYGASEAAVFYSDNITGPYTLHWAGRPLDIKSRDCNVFVDDDGTAYFISTTNENSDLGLFRLSDDYLSVVSHTKLLAGQGREAPAIVKVNGTYFMLSSACSGWDPNQCKISRSTSLTSGWTSLSNIGNANTYDTQAASILTIQGSQGTTYLYVGDRWQDTGLADSKTIIFPVRFSGTTCTFEYRQQFDIDFAKGQVTETSLENRVPKSNWKIQAYSSQETSSENSPATNAIDGNINTKWHSRYSTATAAPHSISVDMGAEYEVSGFLCVPRMDGQTNGLIREFLFYVSTDGKSWKAVAGGSWMPYCAEVYFQPVRARYFRLVALSGNYASIAELEILLSTSAHAAYTPTSITPYYKIGASASYSSSENITATPGDSLTFGPNISLQNGTWAFAGPNNHAAAVREYNIPKVTAADAGLYSSLFLDERLLQISKRDITVSVTGGGASIANPLDTRLEVARKYYDLQGMEIPEPVTDGIYIVKKIYSDASTETVKIRAKFVNKKK